MSPWSEIRYVFAEIHPTTHCSCKELGEQVGISLLLCRFMTRGEFEFFPYGHILSYNHVSAAVFFLKTPHSWGEGKLSFCYFNMEVNCTSITAR